MPKQRTGYVRERRAKTEKGKERIEYYARVTYTDLGGKRKSIERKADSKSQGKALLRGILNDLDQRGVKGIESGKMTFAQYADWYEDNYLIPPKYVDGRKVAGLRSWQDMRYMKKTLIQHFGGAQLKNITFGDLERFKQKRLDTDVVLKKKDGTISVKRQRSIRSVHMELALLRKMLNVAQREGHITRNPFNAGDTLISEADEVNRDRILSRDEEKRLLAVCEGRRLHLRPILICALDTGMRAGEIFKLAWRNVDLFGRNIHILAFNTKTMRKRDVPITDRLFAELSRLAARNQPKPADSVFGIVDTIKRAFKTACEMAGVAEFHFHDCRHTYATRLIQAGMPIEEVARLLGHTSVATTYRYVNATPDTATRAIDILNRLNHDPEP